MDKEKLLEAVIEEFKNRVDVGYEDMLKSPAKSGDLKKLAALGRKKKERGIGVPEKQPSVEFGKMERSQQDKLNQMRNKLVRGGIPKELVAKMSPNEIIQRAQRLGIIDFGKLKKGIYEQIEQILRENIK